MITAFSLAGFLSVHAIWCVSDGETLIPIFGYTTDEGEKRMDRLVSSDLKTSVAMGKSKLTSNESNANDAVLLYDGRIPLNGEKVDAIIVESDRISRQNRKLSWLFLIGPRGRPDPFAFTSPRFSNG